MKFLNKFILMCLAFFICDCSTSRNLEAIDDGIKISSPIKVNYCELALNPEKYSGQTVILKGVYMLQFEASHFISFNCQPKITVTTDFDAPPCSDKSEIEPWDWSSAMLDRAHGVIVKGWFENKIIKGQTTGELPEYYNFKVDCVDKVKRLGTLVVNPKSEAEKVKERIEQFEKEKL